MARVFVSHASEDRTLAGEVHRWLIEAGHEVFLDQDLHDGIAPGEEWEQRLHERLRWANAMLCVVTSAYLNSTWCAAEVGIARSRGSQLLPLRAEPDAAHPLLRSIQHIEYPADPATARAAVIEALYLVDIVWPDDRSPFPGLRPFEVDQHEIFFGRAEEVKHLTELLRSPAERAEGAALLVVGPSGCGKSSLVRAGLLPVLANEPGWRTLPPILPDIDPVTALARELAAAARQSGLDWTIEYVHRQLGQRGLTRLADELLLADPAGPQRRLLIVVDQFEELLTQTSPAERARFTELLRPALNGPVRVVATLRPEFLDQLLLDPDLAALPTRPYPLRPLRREALRTVVEKPAWLAGINVDDGLVDRLVDDTASGEALPLLAFTLAQLADGVTRGGRLSSTRYDQLGGVQGALTHQADAALADAVTAKGRSREQVIAGLLRLVTVDEQGHPTRWRVTRNELPKSVSTELDAFVTRRLLTTDTDNGAVVIGVAHEAFLSAWPPLVEAITANVSALRTRRAVEHAATEWDGDGRPRERLWGGGQLAGAVTDIGARISAGSTPPPGQRNPARWLHRQPRVLSTDRVELSPTARSFLHTSIRHDRFRRRRSISVLSVLLVLALVTAGIAVERQFRAQDRERLAIARQLITQAGTYLEADPHTALQLGITAEKIYPGRETHSNLLSLLSRTRYAGTLTTQTGSVSSGRSVMAFSSDGRTVAIADDDGTAILWDLTDPTTRRQPLSPPLTHTGPVNSMAFSFDGRTLATADDDGTVILWDLTDPTTRRQPLSPPLTHTGPVNSMAFSFDGRTLATNSAAGATLWNIANPTRPRQVGTLFNRHTEAVNSVALSRDGKLLATASNDKTVILWDLANRTEPLQLGQPLVGHTHLVYSVAFSPKGDMLATTSADATVILWDLTDRTTPRQLGSPLTAHTGWVFSAVFSPNGDTLATTSVDGTAILWDLTDRTAPRQLGDPLITRVATVLSAAFSADGQTLATAYSDKSVVLWDVVAGRTASRQLGQPLAAHASPVNSVAFTSDGLTMSTAGENGTVILWDLTDRAAPRQLGDPLITPGGAVTSLAFSPDTRTLATAALFNVVTLWDLSDLTKPRQLGKPFRNHSDSSWVFSVTISPDGQTLATAGSDSFGASGDKTVVLRDLADRNAPHLVGQPLTGHTAGVSSVVFAPDGRTLATASGDRTVILWNIIDPIAPHQLGQPLTGHAGAVNSVAFTPNGRTLVTAGGDRVAILWDITDPAQPKRLSRPLIAHTQNVKSVAISPDGQTMATASSDGTVILWDITDLTAPYQRGQPLTAHTDAVSSVTFHPDGRTLATASTDKTAILWDITDFNQVRDQAVKHACSIVSNGFNQEEWEIYIPELPYQNTCPD